MQRETGVDIRWYSIRYRTLVLLAFLILAAIGAVVQLFRPGFLPAITQKSQTFAIHLFGTGKSLLDHNAAAISARHAHFVNLEGDVQIKHVGSERFQPATLETPLDRGDTVQTQTNGWARIEFADQTAYVLNPASLIVIEENEVSTEGARVAVNVTSGLVDLSTGPQAGRASTSSIHFANSAADLGHDAQAQVNTRGDNGSLVLMTGQAELQHGKERVQVTPYERVAVAKDKKVEVSPVPPSPHLIAPANLGMSVVAKPSEAVTHFQWTSVSGARSYRLRISRSPFFTTMVVNRLFSGTDAPISGLEAGAYYWAVTAVGKTAEESTQYETCKFTLAKPSEPPPMSLSIEQVIQVGRVLVVEGKTDPGNQVFVNDEPVALVAADGSFKHLTPPFPAEGNYPVVVVAKDNGGRRIVRRVEATIR